MNSDSMCYGPSIPEVIALGFLFVMGALMLLVMGCAFYDLIAGRRENRKHQEWTEEAFRQLRKDGIRLHDDDEIDVAHSAIVIADKELALLWIEAEERWKVFLYLASGERLHVTAQAIRRLRQQREVADGNFSDAVQEAAPRVESALLWSGPKS